MAPEAVSQWAIEIADESMFALLECECAIGAGWRERAGPDRRGVRRGEQHGRSIGGDTAGVSLVVDARIRAARQRRCWRAHGRVEEAAAGEGALMVKRTQLVSA